MFKKVSSKEEMEKSYAIRTKVFCEEQKISKEIEFDNLDHLCSHFLIFDDKKVIATARVRQKEENILKIERVAVLFEFRRLKVGSTLIKNIIQYFINLNENISFTSIANCVHKLFIKRELLYSVEYFVKTLVNLIF